MCQNSLSNIKIQIFNNFSFQLEKAWKEFELTSYHYFFQTYDWQKLWYEHQEKYKKPIKNYSIVVRELNEIIMILPLNIDFSYGIRKLNWSGFPFSDYNCPLIHKSLKIDKIKFLFIWDLIISYKKNFDCIIFKSQPKKIITIENPFYHFLNIKLETKNYGIKINKKFELEKSELKNINYQTKRIKNLGKLSFKIAKNHDEIKKLVNFILEHKSKQYELTKAWNLFKIDLYKDFFVSGSCKFKKNLYLTYLSLNEKIITAHLGFIYEKRCYYLFPVYDTSYSKYSPGKILLKKVIDHCLSNSLNYFDLTTGNENYKKKFSNNTSETSFFFKSINYKGTILINTLRFKGLFKKMLKMIK